MFDINKVIHRLYKLCEDDRLKTNSIEKAAQYRLNEDISVKLDIDDVKTFNSIISTIMSSDYFRGNYKKDEIKREIENIITQCLNLELSKRKDYIDNRIRNFKQNLEKEIKDWVFLIPIINLELNTPIYIGNVKISQYSKSFEKRFKKIFWTILNPNPHYTNEWKKNYIEDTISEFKKANNSKNICYAEINLRGFDEICREKSLNDVKTCINVLKLYWINHDERLSSYFGIKGESVSTEIRCILYSRPLITR